MIQWVDGHIDEYSNIVCEWGSCILLLSQGTDAVYREAT